MSAQVLQVVILRDGLLVGTEVFVPGQYTLGSGDVSDLKLDDGSIEQSHAYVYFQNGKVAVQDAGSASGVFVNGHKVATCEVRPVDELQIGPFVLKMRVLAQKPVAKAAPPAEIAALLGTPQPAAGARPPAAAPAPPAVKPAATVVSPRRLAAVPQPAPPPAQPGPTIPPPQSRAAGHLRPVEDFRDEVLTENFVVGKEENEQTRTEAVGRPQARAVAPPPPAPPARVAPPPVAPAIAPVQPPAAQARGPHKVAAPPAQQRRKRPISLPAMPAVADTTGKPRLFIETYWGETRRQARAFGPIKPKKPVVGALDERADVPMFGFGVKEQFVVADQKGSSFRLFIPPGAAVEARGKDGNFYPLPSEQLQATGSRKFVALGNGSAIRLSGDSEMMLVAYVQPPLKRPFVNPLKGIPWLMLFFLVVNVFGLGAFIAFAPKDDQPDFEGRKVPPVALRLIAPEPKKREEIKKKIEEIKKKAPEKKVEKKVEQPKVVEKKIDVVPQSIKKLSAAGPAMKDLLAAVDKLGNGPGKKDAKDYKLSGLIGKAPIANAGLGTFGFGGGGQGGFGTKGAEILRGKGGGGIGALGAGNIGKGSVGGTVAHATAHSIGAQGSIDREAVAKVINSHLQEVRACYERALLKDPSLAGKVVLEWNISLAGLVTTAKTKTSSLKNGAVEGCILTSLKTWKFPPAKGAGVVITYPFMFNSVGF